MKQRWLARARLGALGLTVGALVIGSIAYGQSVGDAAAPASLAVGAVPTLPPPTTTTTLPPPPPTTVTTAPPPTTAPRPRPTTAPRPAPRAVVRAAPILAGSIDGFRGLGAWVDVFDWTNEYTNGKPGVGVAAIDRMADLGVQTLYIQTARHESPDLIVEQERLRPLIDRAHARGMAVIAWYLPTLEDVPRDLARVLASAALPVDGIGIDIESRKVPDAAERSRRLVELSAATREQLPGRPIAAVIMPPVVTDVINTGFWPGFPWKELKPFYDLWMPMNYWTMRTAASGYRDSYRYTAENIDMTRRNLGDPAAVVHAIGGIGDATSLADIDGYHRASAERGAIGGGLYDYRTSNDDHYTLLRRFRV